MSNLGEKITDEEMDEMLEQAGATSSGMIDYEEFVRMMMGGPSSSPPSSSVQVVSEPAPPPPAANSSPCVAPQAPCTSSVDTLQPILLQQAFDGSWALGNPLAEILGVTLERVPTADDLPDTVWATALGLAFLHLRLAPRKDEWILVAAKAEAWLQASGHSPQELLQRAAAALHALLV